ncbi:MAG: DNA polymerase III subunit alpha [Candidatus Pacebacteria bacterium]|nr:DNA polymerase III subunit alpha [Candidatus Paceibacterota bacterium]
MTKFTHLHVHSNYSLLDGLPKIPELIDYVKELGMDSVALTDHGVLYGAVEFYKQAVKKGIKPIIGVEAYMAIDKMDQCRPNIDNKRYHLVLLAKDTTGYKNLVKLVTKAHLKGFYYKPRIDEELLSKYSKGLIGLSACLQGKIPKLILAQKIDQAEKQALKYQEIFGQGNFYLELQHNPNIKEQKIANDNIINISKKYGIPLVATNDVHYLKPEDAKAQDILMLINTGADPNNPERLSMMIDDFSMTPPEKMEMIFNHIPEAIENTQKIKEMCNFEFELGKTILPKFDPPKNYSSTQYLRKLCEENLSKKYSQVTPEIEKRLNEELIIIEKTGFCSYFLIVNDFMNWAKEKGIVQNPRGSVAGSIVSYLLGITKIDPLKYNLLFERFLTGKRISPPDIDVDFADTRRDEVIEYVREKYGKDKVAQIITFGTMAARAAIRDVGRALQYEYSYCDKIAKMIPLGFSLDKTMTTINEFKKIYQEEEKARILIDFAKKLEGVARHASTHACAVVISRDPLDTIVPLQHPSQKDDSIITQYEMRSSEDIGLLKMDFLGLKNLTIIERALKLIEQIQGKKIILDTLPLDDKKTFDLLQKAETTSVFQLESSGMKRYLKELKPTELEDIIAMVALYRPGPMELIPEYIKRKQGKKKIEYLHPKLEPILKSTYGIMIFQEQLMRISRDLACFTPAEADVLRKAVGKKIESLLSEQKEKFIQGTINNKIPKQTAVKIWQWIMPFARYGFNRAHSCLYAITAYQTAYLKANYPVEFMAAVLQSEKTEVERVAFLIAECKRMNINVLAPNINKSFENFTVVDKNEIRFGLEAIKNVGHNIVETIAKERKKNGPFSSITNFVTRIQSKDLNKKSLESLIKAGVFDELEERNNLLFNLEKLLEWTRENQKQKICGQKGLFKSSGFNNKIDLLSVKPATKKEMLTWEKELLGLYITSHPLEDFAELFKNKAILPITNIVKDFLKINKRVKVGGTISGIKRIITKNGKPMLFVTLEDQTDKLEIIAFPRILEAKASHFQENKIVLVSGQINTRDGTPKLICEDIEEIVEE